MLHDYFEDFVQLIRVREADGYNGFTTRWQDGGIIRAGMIPGVVRGLSLGEQAGARQSCVLLHSRTLPLHQGDRLRRTRDGAVFRITGDDALTPESAQLSFAQVRAERLVNLS